MPKIPTFKATGSIEQLAGTTSNIQMGLNNTLASALAPVTEAVVNFKIKENSAQNQAEALRLENDFITDMQSVTQTIKTDPKYALNKDAANVYLKEQSNAFIKKYQSLATNGNVQDKFSNYALAETQKSIFKTDALISNNIIADLNNGYAKQKENLMATAFMDKGIDMATLKTSLEKLAIDTYSSQVSPPELDKLLATIPQEIDLMVGLENVSQAPSKTFELLKDKKYLPSITIEQRKELQEKAKTILRPQIRIEFKNYVEARAAGKEPARFDVEKINEIFTEPEAQKIMVVKEMADNNADNIIFFHTLKNDDIDFNLKAMIEENNATLPGDLAKESNNFLIQSVENIKLDRQDNPVKYILDTNPDIENEAINVSNMSAAFAAPNQYETSAMDEAQLNLTERIIEEQKLLGIKNIKVMTNEQSQSFVASYNEAAKLSDGDKLNGMMLSLASNYGDNEGLAIQQLRADGLAFGALVSSGLANSVLAEIALSFDTKEEKTEIEKFLKISKIDKGEMQEEIKDGIADFINIVRKNTPNDSSDSLKKTNEIEEFLTFVAAQKMNGNPDMSQGDAIQFAVDSWNNNFVLTDTYYIGKQQGDKKLNLNETNRIQDTTDLLRTYYLDELDVVAFQSNIEDDPVVLSNKMRSQMSINGEWRNTADGEGVIFGIVLDNGFAPVINNKGEQIIFKFDDRSGLVPGTDIVIDFDVGFNEPENTPATILIDTFEKANQLARDEGITYEEALEKIRKPNISNIEFDNGKKNSKIPVDDQSSMLQFDENSQPQFASLDNITGNLNFVRKIWSKYYQTGGKNKSNLKKESNALSKLILPYTVPKDALNSINKVSNIFENQKITDGRLSKEIIVDYLSKIGQIETQYDPKKIKQSGNYIEETKFLARSYWQVEPRSARSLIQENFNITKQNKEPLFGPKFEKTFRKSYPKGNSVLQYLSTLSEKQLVPILENDMDLAATFAAADLITKLMRPDSIDI
jgi:hypothetical protein